MQVNITENCQNCSQADKIVIAGKTFCANCGTPDSTDAVTLTSTPNIPANSGIADTPPVQNASPPIQANTTPSTTPNEAVATTLTSENSSSSINNAQTKEAPNVAPDPSQTPSAIQKFSAPSTSSAQPTNTLDLNSPQQAKSESSGNEISSLDTKDEQVFSDAQFDELAKTKNENSIVSNPGAQSAPDPANTPATESVQSQNLVQPKPTAKPAPQTVVPMADIRPNTPAQTVYKPDSIPAVANSAQTPQSTAPVPTSVSPAVDTILTQPSQASQVPNPQENNKKKSSKGGKVASVALSAVGLLIIGAYVWQVNYPNLALKVASSKAGVNASVPSYLPNGWQVSGDIQSNPGTVSYRLSSSDGKNANVNQSKTDWDSQALAENYVSNHTDKYLALQAEGLTIYIYNNQASWINKGTWYRIEGSNTGLNQDQLIKMATSL